MIFWHIPKTAMKSENPVWFYSGLHKEWIPNLTDTIALYDNRDCSNDCDLRSKDNGLGPTTETEQSGVSVQRRISTIGVATGKAPLPVGIPTVSKAPPIKPTRGEGVLDAVQRAIERQELTSQQQKTEALQREYFELTKADLERSANSDMAQKWVKTYSDFYALGFKPYGPRNECIYTGLPANSVDHAPSKDYIERKSTKDGAYHGRRVLVACDLRANEHKHTFGSECLWQCAERIAYRAEVTRSKKDKEHRMKIIEGVRSTWPRTDHPCPCILCLNADPEIRKAQIMADPRTTAPVPSKRK